MIQDIGRLWFAPGALFRSLRERPRGKGVLLVLLVVVALATLLVLDIVMQEASQADLEVHAQEHPARLQQPTDRIQAQSLVLHAVHRLAGDHVVEAGGRCRQLSHGGLPELHVPSVRLRLPAG